MAGSQDRRLGTGATLAEAVQRLPQMWRGAGGVLAVSAALALISGLAPLAGWVHTVAWALAVVLGLTAFGAVTRIGVAVDLDGARRLGLGPAGFQLTRTEARLAGATLLCALFLSIILSLLALVALAMFGAAGLDAEAVRARDWAAVGPGWKLALLAFVGLVVLGTPVLLAVRLSLFAPATVGRGQMISLTATPLTNGNILPLLAGCLVCKAPSILWLVLVVSGVLTGPAAIVVGIVLVAGLQAPLMAGFLGAAYRQLATAS